MVPMHHQQYPRCIDRACRQLPPITFIDQDFIGSNPEQNDPMVITKEVANFAIKKVLVDQGSSVDRPEVLHTEVEDREWMIPFGTT
ncbi:hypothetical protein CR513_61367, partial [Mucuna pruriens]